MLQSIETHPDERRDRLNQIYCALAVALVVLACLPFAAVSFNDDWSYSHITLNLAKTGHMAYDGWCTPTLLLQAYWGGLLIRLFGFSFELLRFSTLPVAMGCGVLCYRLIRMAGLTSALAMFGSLTCITSPLFIPLAASFMTDVYGCFFTLLTIYCGASAGKELLSNRQRVLWLGAATLAGYVGGLDRQTVYIAPGAMLLWAVWRWRRERVVLTAAIFMGAIFGAAALLTLRWQSHQPLGSGELVDEVVSWRKAAIFPAQFILTLTLWTLPAAMGLGTRKLRTAVRSYAISLIAVLGGFALFWKVGHRLLFPWLLNLITQYGILQRGDDMVGQRPAILGQAVRVAVTLVVLAVLVQMLALLLDSALAGARERGFIRRVWNGFCEWPPVLQMSSVFAAVYFTLLTLQARLVVFDRYLLPLIPLVVILLLYTARGLPGRFPAAMNWALLAILAIYGVANTHDYFAGLSARETAFERVQSLGIARSQISGGFELDGWTEMELTGRVLYTPRATENDQASYEFLPYAPEIRPQYYLAWSDQPGLQTSPLEGVRFKTWMPPFGREVKILIREGK